MDKYIIFLRGINVGGNNKVSMKELKGLFEKHDFMNVITYINSGNIIFSNNGMDEEKLHLKCHQLLEENYPFKIPFVIISNNDLLEALNNAPKWWDTGVNAKHNAIFVIPPISIKEVFDNVGEAKPKYEKVASHGKIIFWSAQNQTFSKTRWSQIASKYIYNNITIRNANTTKKVLSLAQVK